MSSERFKAPLLRKSEEKALSSPLSVKIPVSRDYSVGKLAKWLNSLEDATEKVVDSFTNSELKLIILCAKDSEISFRNQHVRAMSFIQISLSTISDSVVCLSKEMEENLSAMVDTSTTLKSYAEVASEKLDYSKELRNILREEETNRKMAADEDNDRRKGRRILLYMAFEKMLYFLSVQQVSCR